MTRGSNMKSLELPKNVENFLDVEALVTQFIMTMTSLLTCTPQVLLVAISPSGGKQQLCVSFVLPTCVTRLTPAAGGGEAAPGFACPGARAAAAFLAAM